MTVDASLFKKNQAIGGLGYEHGIGPDIAGDAFGNGIFNSSGSLLLQNSAVIHNQANGGSLVNGSVLAIGGTGWGGAIYSQGTTTVVNSTFSDNSANGGGPIGVLLPTGKSGFGGAIALNSGGKLSLLNVTMASNFVEVGAGTYNQDSLPTAKGASIFIENSASGLTNTILSCAASQTNVWVRSPMADTTSVRIAVRLFPLPRVVMVSLHC
jgi:hypothetical protein